MNYIFKGQISRLNFFLGLLFFGSISVIFSVLFELVLIPFLILIFLQSIITLFIWGLVVRRLHDFGVPGLMSIIFLIPSLLSTLLYLIINSQSSALQKNFEFISVLNLIFSFLAFILLISLFFAQKDSVSSGVHNDSKTNFIADIFNQRHFTKTGFVIFIGLALGLAVAFYGWNYFLIRLII